MEQVGSEPEVIEVNALNLLLPPPPQEPEAENEGADKPKPRFRSKVHAHFTYRSTDDKYHCNYCK